MILASLKLGALLHTTFSAGALMRKLLSLLVALTLPLAGCGDDGNPAGPGAEGSLSFTYSGDISGTFAVSGGKGREGERYPRNEFAAASRSRSGGFVRIDGVRPTQHPKLDFVGMSLLGVTGPKTITVCAIAAVAPDCADVQFTLGENVTSSGLDPDHVYVFTSGSVTVSEITAERVRGTFQGTGASIEPMGQVNFARTIAVTNGQFDVPVVREF